MTTQRQTPVAEAAERSHLALRRAVVDVAVSLLRARVLSCSGHAHLSARVGPDSVLITTLSQMLDLGPDDLAVIRLDGTVTEGDLAEMSTEMVAILVAFALARRPLPVRYEPLLHLGQAEEVPVVPWAPGSSANPVSAVIDLIKQRPGTRAVLLANDGVLAFGPDTEAAVSLLVALEEAAEAELRAAALGGAAELPGSGLADVREAMPQELPRD
jgi:L-ribulose-5-phosphate 4-epimerase